jgi:sulfate transport system permease protein
MASKQRRKRARVIPGFGLSMGFSLAYLSFIVLIPMTALFSKCATMGWHHFLDIVTSPRVLASFRLTFGASFAAASLNGGAGLLVGWVLGRYDFPGKRFFDAVVDLPFALPTAVAGIALTSLYVPTGLIGRYLAPRGIQIAFRPAGIILALAFVGFPFVVRSVQPVLEDLDKELEEAASSLGANSWQTFRLVLFPSILPALLTGVALAFARALGEYGSVIFIAGNMPLHTEITSLLIVSKLEQYDTAGAAAIALVMLVISFVLLLVINLLQAKTRKYQEAQV